MDLLREDQAFRMRDANGKVLAEVTFPIHSDDIQVWDVNHTWVDPVLRGQGVASKLVIAVDEAARREGKRLLATCPYVITWYQRHSDKQDILAEPL